MRAMSWPQALTLMIAWSTSVTTGSAPIEAQQTHDLVITGGRVVDPETGFDGIANVAVRDGRIVSVSEEPMTAARTMDTTGLVVAPGFIDPLASPGAAHLPSAL